MEAVYSSREAVIQMRESLEGRFSSQFIKIMLDCKAEVENDFKHGEQLEDILIDLEAAEDY